jgi:hypothetical protein
LRRLFGFYFFYYGANSLEITGVKEVERRTVELG